MTIQEINEQYGIPMEILQEYESWKQCGNPTKNIPCDDCDIECLSLLTTLHDIGFNSSESKDYMQSDTFSQQIKLLEQKRRSTLNKIHLLEQQIEKIDYLRYQIRKQQETQTGISGNRNIGATLCITSKEFAFIATERRHSYDEKLLGN